MEKKHKHLEFIQGVIGRMASNLFLLKGWTVTLIAGLFALAASNTRIVYFLLAYLAAFAFWILDGYFLAMERRFRALYDEVRKRDESDIDYSMDISPFKNTHTWWSAVTSVTLRTYYGLLILIMFMIVLALRMAPHGS